MGNSYPIYFFIVGFGILVSGLSLFFVEKSVPRSLPGGKEWAFGGLFVFVAFLLIGVEEWLPEFISTSVANSLFVVAMTLYLISITNVTDQDQDKKIFFWIFGLAFIGEIFFTSLVPNYSLRIVILMIALIILTIMCLVQLVNYKEPRAAFPKYMMVSIFSGGIILFLWRIIIELIEYDPQKTTAQLGLVLDITVSGVFVLTTLLTISFLLLSNAVNYSKIHKLAYEDSLTGTVSRRAILDRISEAISGTNRSGIPFSIILIDFDNLKEINDYAGHLAGDEALIKITQCVKSNLRTGDVIGRFGGDEFVIVFQNTNIKGAAFVTERIVNLIRSMKHSFNKPVMISIGGTQYDPGNRSLDELIAQADKNLYTVKRKGGDDYLITAFSN